MVYLRGKPYIVSGHPWGKPYIYIIYTSVTVIVVGYTLVIVIPMASVFFGVMVVNHFCLLVDDDD